MRPDDSHEVSQLNELKIDVSALCVGAHYALAGVNVMVEQMPIYGGYAGGLEETTIVDVATTLNSFVMMQGTWHLDGPVHVRWGITTTREALAVAGHACRAIEAHTHLMLGNQYYTLAGLCTVMCLLETAAQAITDTCSGREVLSGVASCKGVTTDLFTAMEARMMGEAAHAVAGMDTHEVNVLLNKLVAIYEKEYKTALKGKKFQECYDVKTLTPTEEYVTVYDEAVKILTPNACAVSCAGSSRKPGPRLWCRRGGGLDHPAIRALHEAGADWYALYQETHNRALFARMRVGQSYDARMAAKRYAKSCGLLIEEGLLSGIGETPEDMADSFRAMRALGAAQVRTMALVPQAGTPLSNIRIQDSTQELKTIAVMRLLFPRALIPASLDVDGLQGLESRLNAGANVITSIIPPHRGLAGVAQAEQEISEECAGKVGVSVCFQGFLHCGEYFAQAAAAAQIGMQCAGNLSVYHFADYRLPYIVKYGVCSLPLDTLIPESLRRLLEYDRENHTDYCRTLKIYFASNQNITETMGRLYLHRSTVKYRLKKIQEISGIDYTDQDQQLYLEMLFFELEEQMPGVGQQNMAKQIV